MCFCVFLTGLKRAGQEAYLLKKCNVIEKCLYFSGALMQMLFPIIPLLLSVSRQEFQIAQKIARNTENV